jgi:hypothetical protein
MDMASEVKELVARGAFRAEFYKIIGIFADTFTVM